MMMWKSLDPRHLADLLIRIGSRQVAGPPANPDGYAEQDAADPPANTSYRSIADLRGDRRV